MPLAHAWALLLHRFWASLPYLQPRSAMPQYSAVLPTLGLHPSALGQKYLDFLTYRILQLSAPLPDCATETVRCTANKNRLPCFCKKHRGKNNTYRKSRDPKSSRIAAFLNWNGAVYFKACQRTFLFSAPGVVTITFSGVMSNAPFAVAAPWNMLSTICLNFSTTAPEVTYSAVPLI